MQVAAGGIYSPPHQDQCRESMKAVCSMAGMFGYQQLLFSEPGPDLHEGLQLLCGELLPPL